MAFADISPYLKGFAPIGFESGLAMTSAKTPPYLEGFTQIDSESWLRKLYDRFWGKGEMQDPITHTPNPDDLDYIDLQGLILHPHIHSQLLVLRQYDYFVDRIEALRQRDRALKWNTGVVLSGNSGSGKTVFLIYLFIRYLLKRQIVAYYDSGHLNVFTDDGAFQCCIPGQYSHLQSTVYHVAPVLIDVDFEVQTPPAAIMTSSFFPIQASPPRTDYYRSWSKRRRATFLVMSPLEDSELLAITSLTQRAIPLHKETTEQRSDAKPTVKELASLYGRDVRTIRDVQQRSGTAHRDSSILHEIKSLRPSDFFRALRMPYDTTPDISDFLITTSRATPLPSNGSRDYYVSDTMVHSLQSHHIYKLVSRHYLKQDRDTRRQFIQGMFGIAETASLFSWIAESWSHDYLSGLEEPVTLEKLTWDEEKNHLLRDKSESLQLSMWKRDIDTYASSTQPTLTRDVDKYYIPAEPNNPTFDSFIHPCFDLGIGFQTSIVEVHSLKADGLKMLIERLDASLRYFVFVIPKGHNFRCHSDMPPPSLMSRFIFCLLEVPSPLAWI